MFFTIIYIACLSLWCHNRKTTVSAANNPSLTENFTGGKVGQMWETGVGGAGTMAPDLSLYAEANYRKEVEGYGAKGWRYNVGIRWLF